MDTSHAMPEDSPIATRSSAATNRALAARSGQARERRTAWRASRRTMEETFDLFNVTGRIARRKPDAIEVVGNAVRGVLEASGLDRWAFRSALDVRRRAIEVTVRSLPPGFDGYTILHLADPHFDAIDGLAPAICRACDGLEVDLLAITGDLRAADWGPFVEHHVIDALAGVMDVMTIRDGAFAVLGNHDSQDMVEPVSSLGIELLTNEEVRIRRGGATLSLIGLDDPHRFFTPSTAAFLDDLGPGGDACRVFLVHSPELATPAARCGGALYLSGHTHGGQICLPGGRPIISHLHAERDLATGLWRRAGMVGYTSPGAGVSRSLPIRAFSRSEVTVFTLRCEHRD